MPKNEPVDFDAAEYELKHFGFSVEELQESFQEMLKNKVNDATKSLISMLIEKPELKHLTDKFKECSDTFKQNILTDCADSVKKINQMFVEAFSIPDHVLLLEDEELLARNLSDEDFRKLQLECEEYEKSTKNNKILIAQLKDELEMYKNLNDFFLKTAEVIENSDEVLRVPIDEEQLRIAMEKMKHLEL